MVQKNDKRSSSSEKFTTELQNEIATVDRDITRYAYGKVLYNLDPTLLTRGASKGLSLYEEIEKDCHAFAVLQKRRLAVVCREWYVDAGGENQIDIDAAAEVEKQLKNLPFDDICVKVLDAVLKGFSVGEIIWEMAGNRIVVKQILARDQRRFAFGKDGSLRLLTLESPVEGIELPATKFIVHRSGGKTDDPYGLGLGTRLFWPVFFKRQGITFWLTFADKFGSPTAVGKYPVSAAKTDQDKLLAALGALAQDAGVIIPEGMAIEFLEAARSGTVNTYESLCRYMDEQVSEAVLGETGSTNQSGDSGSRARDEVGNGVRLEIAKADGDLQCGTLNETLVKWIVDFNFPGAAYPKVWRNFECDEDLKTSADRDKVIYDMGFEPDETYINETYGGKWTKRQVTPQPAFGFAEKASIAEKLIRLNDRRTSPEDRMKASNKQDQDEMENAADSLAGDYEKLLGNRVEDLMAMFEETKDFGLFKKKLIQLMNGKPDKGMVQALERANFAATLIGRAKKAS